MENGEGETIVEDGESSMNENGLSEGDESEYKLLRRLYGKMLGYMNTLPVLGFNSSRYDIPLVLTGLARHLVLETKKMVSR